MSASFDRVATQSAITKRPKSDGTGMATHLEDLAIVPLLPISPETIERLGLNSPREQKETFARSQTHTDDGAEVSQVPDIRQGDSLVVSERDYLVQAVAEWNDGSHDYLNIVVDQKR